MNIVKHSSFFKYSFIVFFALALMSCKQKQEKSQETKNEVVEVSKPFFKLSLAQWSLHRAFNEEGVDPFLFADMSKEMGFEGIEYVSQIYKKQIENLGMDVVVDSLKVMSELANIENVLIMVDHEGDLADPDEALRNQAVENHKKWIDAAQKLGCHAIRVNTFGTNDPEVWKVTVVDGLKKLSEYAATKNINVLCENHGWLSSDAPKLTAAIKEVNMENCGTLPDFGNWCVKRDLGERWGECIEVYPDKYEGIKLLLLYAKAVSAKSYDFDEAGNETTLDFSRILKLVKDSGYTGYIGVEFEGKRLSEREGIERTRDLLFKSANSLK